MAAAPPIVRKRVVFILKMAEKRADYFDPQAFLSSSF